MPTPLDPSWMPYLGPELKMPYMQELKKFLQGEAAKHKVIYPAGADIFNAFNLTPLHRTTVVIIGQDPYHGPGQAHGLCFSVRPQVKPPPSLLNIYQEIKNEYGTPIPHNGYLRPWAVQGVLLLNSVLTVEADKPGSHQGHGWETFTSKAVEILNAQRNHLVFMLWGKYAQDKCRNIDPRKHLILTSPHPSPLSAHRGFLGNGHFKKANAFLKQHHLPQIDWAIEDEAKDLA
ncbi:MAG: uracil-DNA glycosylase [Bacteriovoracaceae bacterium]|nr:uracil-DNA glycosylase [Bacteriovoracaceae bacterium]